MKNQEQHRVSAKVSYGDKENLVRKYEPGDKVFVDKAQSGLREAFLGVVTMHLTRESGVCVELEGKTYVVEPWEVSLSPSTLYLRSAIEFLETAARKQYDSKLLSELLHFPEILVIQALKEMGRG